MDQTKRAQVLRTSLDARLSNDVGYDIVSMPAERHLVSQPLYAAPNFDGPAVLESLSVFTTP